MKQLILPALVFVSTAASAQNRLRSTHELSVNGFRNPSIGLEYRYRPVSAHLGYYPTNFEPGVTTSFIRAGVSLWLLPVGNNDIPSSFYVSGSYLRGLNRDYNDENAFIADVGFRWMIRKGWNVRAGGAMLVASGHDPQFNPTIGVGYAFLLSSRKQ